MTPRVHEEKQKDEVEREEDIAHRPPEYNVARESNSGFELQASEHHENGGCHGHCGCAGMRTIIVGMLI